METTMSMLRPSQFITLSLVSFAVVATASPARATMYYPGTLHFEEFTTIGTKWNPGPNSASAFGVPPGTPGSATWSAMAAGISAASGITDPHGGNLTSSLLVIDGAGGVDELAQFNAALNLWDAVSGFTNLGMVADSGAPWGDSDANNGHIGDIRAGAVAIDGGFNVLAHAFQPGTNALFAPDGSVAGDVHFDDAEPWVDDPANLGLGIDFFTVALHELGHALGLGHSADPNSVMFATYQGTRRTLGADDIAGIQAIYGAQQQPPTGPIEVPEPSTLALLGLGLAGWVVKRRRRSAA